MAEVETVYIVNPEDESDYLIINKSDFDSSKHVIYEGVVDTPDDDKGPGQGNPPTEGGGGGNEGNPPNPEENRTFVLDGTLFNRATLEELEFFDLKDYANQFGITGRGRAELLSELEADGKILS